MITHPSRGSPLPIPFAGVALSPEVRNQTWGKAPDPGGQAGLPWCRNGWRKTTLLFSPTRRKERVGSASSPLDGWPCYDPKAVPGPGWVGVGKDLCAQPDHPLPGAPQLPFPARDPLPTAGGEDGVWEKGRLPRKVQLCVQAQGLGWNVLGVSRGYITAALWLRA